MARKAKGKSAQCEEGSNRGEGPKTSKMSLRKRGQSIFYS